MARPVPAADPVVPPGVVPEGTTELGIDIIKVDRIANTIQRFGDRFARRVLTERERRYVRNRPENFAGRWAAKEAVSKVLGLGVRGVGWTEIEIERLPTGQPSVRLNGRAAKRAEQLGMGRIAVSISHEAEYAVAVAFGVRTAGGRYVFPLDIDDRLDDRERKLLARFERMQQIHQATQALAADIDAAAPEDDGHEDEGAWLTAEPSGSAARPPRTRPPPPAAASSDVPPELDDETMSRLVPERDKRGHKGSFGRLLVLAGSMDYAGAAPARVPRRRPGRRRAGDARGAGVAPAAVRGQGRGGDDDGAPGGRRRGGRPGARARRGPRP